jgi:hypothetical protein
MARAARVYSSVDGAAADAIGLRGTSHGGGAGDGKIAGNIGV